MFNLDLGADRAVCEDYVLDAGTGAAGTEYWWSTGDSTQTITLTNVSADSVFYVDVWVPFCGDFYDEVVI